MDIKSLIDNSHCTPRLESLTMYCKQTMNKKNPPPLTQYVIHYSTVNIEIKVIWKYFYNLAVLFFPMQ